MKVWSLLSTHIFKNVMNNYALTLVIWWKRKTFIYCIKCYWIKNLLSMVIKNKKFLVVFHKHEINSTTWSMWYIWFVCFFSFFMQNWILRYTCKYLFQHVLKFSFYNLHFLELRDVFRVFFKRYFFISNVQNLCEEKD